MNLKCEKCLKTCQGTALIWTDSSNILIDHNELVEDFVKEVMYFLASLESLKLRTNVIFSKTALFID